jgi:hypothetical protein
MQQSMAYNGLSDIPQLLLILFLAALYAFRKKFPVVFGQITFMIVYYV